MKNRWNAKRLLILIAALSVLISGSIFMVLYADQYVEANSEDFVASSYNSIVVTPKNMGSYGEMMFAYIGEENYLYNLDDETEPLINQAVSQLLYASDDTVIYTTVAELSAEHAGRESIIQELQIGENENTLNTIASVTIDPCWSSNDEVVYYVQDGALNQLCTFEPLTSTSEIAAEFEEEITGLRISSDGLLVTVASGEEKLYVPLSKQLTETYYNCQGSRVIVCEQYDLILTPDGNLYYRWMGANDAVKIAENVTVMQGYQDNEILFIRSTNDGLTLNAYFVSEERTVELVKLPDHMLPQLTVSPDYTFVIDDDFVIYRYNIDTQELGAFEIVPDDVLNPMIAVFDYRLMIYDLSREGNQTYISATEAAQTVSAEAAAAIQAYSETSAKSRREEYSEYNTLQMASIGGDVYALQEKLVSLGYLSSLPTGIYDVSTTVAVQYLQADLGVPESGIASGELQYWLFNSSPVQKTQYTVLSTSSRGIRVRDLQARLYTLGYLKTYAKGQLDALTTEALKCFATQNGVEYEGGLIKAEVQELLFSDMATSYHGYLDLQPGDCCNAVTLLGARLKELGYLTGAVEPDYGSKTTAAVVLFAQVNKMQTASGCDQAFQILIFSEDAVPCPQELAPQAINDSLSSTEGQTISDRQLKILRKWLTKQFAVNHTDRQAVKRLQMQLVKLGYLSLEDVTMVYDQPTMDAVEAFQKENSIEANGIASKSTLTAIFNTTITNAIAEE